MKNNKEFTLIELLAMITLLLLVTFFTTSTTLKIINNPNEKFIKQQLIILKIATFYIKENSDKITFIDNRNSQ